MITTKIICFSNEAEPILFERMRKLMESYYHKKFNDIAHAHRVLLGWYAWIMKKHGSKFNAYMDARIMRLMSSDRPTNRFDIGPSNN